MLGKKIRKAMVKKKAIPDISLASPLAPSLLRYPNMAVSTMDSASTTTRKVGAAVSSSCLQGGIFLGWRRCLSWQCLICGTWLSTTLTSPSCTCAKSQVHHLCIHNLKIRWGHKQGGDRSTTGRAGGRWTALVTRIVVLNPLAIIN